jgi:hypothetical protein
MNRKDDSTAVVGTIMLFEGWFWGVLAEQLGLATFPFVRSVIIN